MGPRFVDQCNDADTGESAHNHVAGADNVIILAGDGLLLRREGIAHPEINFCDSRKQFSVISDRFLAVQMLEKDGSRRRK